MTEQDALIILNAVNGFGNGRIQKLMERYGSAQEVLNVSPDRLLEENGITPKICENLKAFNQEAFLKQEHALLEKHQARVIGFQDECYPALLKKIPDFPVLLYWKGALETIDSLSVAIVGSRKASAYGLSSSERFAGELSNLGVTVISGMARGVDTIAHQGALAKQGLTVAVLGSGLANIYPRENARLFYKIAETGAVISEFPMRTEPISYNFPRRNRIISGLSLGVIVIEAFERSGALITSRLALEQGREVFALPGNINNPAAQGTNSLIKQGAKLMTSLEDVLEELKVQMSGALNAEKLENQPEGAPPPPPDLSREETKIYAILGDEPMHIDMIANQSARSVSELSSVVLGLEMKRLIKPLPGKFYVKR